MSAQAGSAARGDVDNTYANFRMGAQVPGQDPGNRDSVPYPQGPDWGAFAITYDHNGGSPIIKLYNQVGSAMNLVETLSTGTVAGDYNAGGTLRIDPRYNSGNAGVQMSFDDIYMWNTVATEDDLNNVLNNVSGAASGTIVTVM
jgi:hypothetical protein